MWHTPKFISCCIALVWTTCTVFAQQVYHLSDMGLKPHKSKNVTVAAARAMKRVFAQRQGNEEVILKLAPGEYHFYEKGAATKEYYISNHDQTNPKRVSIALEEIENCTLDGQGATLVFHGRMLPLSLVKTKNCTVKNLSIDFANPHIAQVEIVENRGKEGMVFKPAPWVSYRCTPDSVFETYGEGWKLQPNFGIAFEPDSRHIVYGTSDVYCPTKGVHAIENDCLLAPQWIDNRLKAGHVIAMRTWQRPAPGIFVDRCVNTTLDNVKVHYAEGMGLLAQLSEDITLRSFAVCLKGDDDARYFTTQADATHFSGCKGKIISDNGLYEGMMDDAINVHGTYLKVMKRIDDKTLVGRYMHDQSWGFDWGYTGDEVQFIRSSTMEYVGEKNRIATIRPYDKETPQGAREWVITFEHAIDPSISEADGFGIENLTWTPEVTFSNNIVRNNRARGALFSTPQNVVVEHNLFDHTSGTAILLCGDCNGWYETGSCRHVQIRHNRFVNALTNMFQFTNAVISIYPEIPNLKDQKQYFHGGKDGGIVIENNEFVTFDKPIVYAKSVDGLIFRNNLIRTSTDYKPFHSNQNRFWLEHVTGVQIEE